MLFTSYNFILFLVVLFIIYYLIPKKYQWMLLLLGSFVFYSYSGWDNVAYITVTILATYFVSLKIGQLYEQQDSTLKKTNSLAREDRKKYKAKLMQNKRSICCFVCYLILYLGCTLNIRIFVISNIIQ